MAVDQLKFSTELPDSIQQVSAAVSAHIGFLSDVREFYVAKALLEREHSTKLQLVIKKAQERRGKRVKEMVVGDEPSKTYVDGSGEALNNTLDSAWTRILSEAEEEATDRLNLSESLSNDIAESLKTFERKKEETRKRHFAFAGKLVADRDKAYGERTKTKDKYDEACENVESYRQKQGGAKDERHQEKAARGYETGSVDMYNAKNTYIVSTAVSNRLKARFYQVDLPSIHDDFQSLWTHLVTKLVTILQRAIQHNATCLESLIQHNNNVSQAVLQIDPAKDQSIFIEYNKRPFAEPPDFAFEPCSIWHDDGDLNVMPEPKVFLQNKLARSRARLAEIGPQIESKRREVSGLDNLTQAYSKNEALGDADEVMENLFDALRQTITLETNQTACEQEIETIVEALGDDQGSQQPHAFKAAAFPMPAPCELCSQNIWGIAKQGLTCKTCGINVHTKCEMKVPANCPGAARAPPIRKASVGGSSLNSQSGGGGNLVRQSSTASRYTAGSLKEDQSSPASPASPVSSVADLASRLGRMPPGPSSGSGSTSGQQVKGTMKYGYEATTAFEVTAHEGESFSLLEPDDGSGWIKILTQAGRSGLVPASYVELDGTATASSEAPRARALYAWTAQDSDEHSVAEGEVVELTDQGMTYAEGWAQIMKDGRAGIVPSNYLEAV